MKKSVEILGLPIISITEGREMGTAKTLVIDAGQGAVAAIAVEDGKWYLGAKLLPYASVAGIGENAITVENSNNILSLANSPDMESLLEADVKVIGAKVLTKSGRFQGKVVEIVLDDSGKIINCEVEEQSGQKIDISGDNVITFGKEVVIIDDGTANVADKPMHVSPAKPSVESVPAATVAASKETAVVDKAVTEKEEQVTAKETENTHAQTAHASSGAPQAEATDEAVKKFDDKQRKYLLGKKATRRVATDNGVVIVEAGGEITEEVIQKAKLAGKFVELSMSL